MSAHRSLSEVVVLWKSAFSLQGKAYIPKAGNGGVIVREFNVVFSARSPKPGIVEEENEQFFTDLHTSNPSSVDTQTQPNLSLF